MVARGTRTGTLAVFGIAVLVNLILSIFLLDQVRRTREQVAELSDELASKQDVAMLRPIHIDGILKQRCVRCHTERRFAKLSAMTEPQILETIQRMRSHPGANIPADEVREIEAALLAFRCTSCHGEGVLSQLYLMPQEERTRFLRTKVAMPNSGFRSDQVGELIEAFDYLAGRPR
jgi:NAD-dependent SIR2 family protein deacetylase